jgi:hypothetical protein
VGVLKGARKNSRVFYRFFLNVDRHLKGKVKVKFSGYRPEQALGDPVG